jgi:hypothetical protein
MATVGIELMHIESTRMVDLQKKEIAYAKSPQNLPRPAIGRDHVVLHCAKCGGSVEATVTSRRTRTLTGAFQIGLGLALIAPLVVLNWSPYFQSTVSGQDSASTVLRGAIIVMALLGVVLVPTGLYFLFDRPDCVKLVENGSAGYWLGSDQVKG